VNDICGRYRVQSNQRATGVARVRQALTSRAPEQWATTEGTECAEGNEKGGHRDDATSATTFALDSAAA